MDFEVGALLKLYRIPSSFLDLQHWGKLMIFIIGVSMILKWGSCIHVAYCQVRQHLFVEEIIVGSLTPALPFSQENNV